MKNETTEEIFETLGQYLRRTRIEKQLEITSVAENTKISPRVLHAIEDDDSHNLPAPGFTRGFYRIYAEFLGLDGKKVVQRFDSEILRIQNQKKNAPPQIQHNKEQIASFAAPPVKGKWSIAGLYTVLIVAFAAFLCWYLSWNPATFLSEQLRSLQHIEKPLSNPLKDTQPPDVTSPEVETSKANPLQAPRYSLTINFLADTRITTVVDAATSEEGVYSEGSTRSWYGNNSISLTLPEDAQVKIFFNGIHINALPQPIDGQIHLHFP